MIHPIIKWFAFGALFAVVVESSSLYLSARSSPVLQHISSRNENPSVNCASGGARNNSKIDNRINCVIVKLQAESVTADNAERLNIQTRYSTAFVRVDKRARIHLEIE